MSERFAMCFGKRRFTVEVLRSPRKGIALTVHPDMSVTARIPQDAELETVRRHARKRAAWIARQVDYFEKYHPLPAPREYVSGETHYYLGRQYRLRIRRGPADRVHLKGAYFELEIDDPSNNARVKRILLSWYSRHARELLSKKVALFSQRILSAPADEVRVIFRRMSKRWGSCSSRRTILLNTELIKAPAYCIDYVIVHELCHLLHPHHDAMFYRLLKKHIPDWESRKERLEMVQL